MKKILIFIVAYHAESHIASVLERIPKEIWGSEKYTSEVLIIDDASADRTKQICDIYKETQGKFNLRVLRNPVNQGYGGNQKIGYHYAVKNNFDVVVLLHGDGQYAPENLPKMLEPILKGEADAVFGSRMLSKLDALKGGMPLYKFFGNRILTIVQNFLLGTNLSEFHSGYRAYSVKALRSVPFQCNSNDFDFDTDIIIQFIDNKFKIKEIAIPTFYGNEICYVNGVKYAINIINSTILSRLQKFSVYYNPKYDYPSKNNNIYQSKTDFPSSHQFAVNEVKSDSIVVDIGCGGCYVAKKLKEKGCTVFAYDISISNEARTFCDAATEIQLNNFKGDMKINSDKIDVILLLDIIEHLDSPEEFLLKLRDNFANFNPKIVITVPNIAFIIQRASLLFGKFNYGRRGILDLTHKRFFTFFSLVKILTNCGYTVNKKNGIPVPFELGFGKNFFSSLLTYLNLFLIMISKGLFSYQIALTSNMQPTLNNLLIEAEKSVVHDKTKDSSSK